MALTPEIAVAGLVANRAKLLAYIWSLLGDHHDTEDIFEEVIVLAMKSAPSIVDDDHLLAWARRAARSRAINLLRRENRKPLLLADDVLDQLDPHWRDWDAQPDTDRIDALRDCVEQLSPRARQIVSLRYGQGLSGAQVADVVGQQVHSVYVALTRIYQALEACVRRRLAEGAAP